MADIAARAETALRADPPAAAAGDLTRKAGSALQRLIEVGSPLWAGEAEVFSTYWDWSRRTVDSDCTWLTRQCFKELFDGFLPGLRDLSDRFPSLEEGDGRTAVLESAHAAYRELAHYCAFADTYDALRGHRPALSISGLKETGNWDANVDLELGRVRHRWEFGDIAARATAVTERGYCTLYSGGMGLAGRGGADDLIAIACAAGFEYQWDRTIACIAAVDDDDLAPEALETLLELCGEQMKLQIRMRNAQFGHPLPPERLRAIDAGDVDPLPFDYAKAGFLTP